MGKGLRHRRRRGRRRNCLQKPTRPLNWQSNNLPGVVWDRTLPLRSLIGWEKWWRCAETETGLDNRFNTGPFTPSGKTLKTPLFFVLVQVEAIKRERERKKTTFLQRWGPSSPARCMNRTQLPRGLLSSHAEPGVKVPWISHEERKKVWKNERSLPHSPPEANYPPRSQPSLLQTFALIWPTSGRGTAATEKSEITAVWAAFMSCFSFIGEKKKKKRENPGHVTVKCHLLLTF